MKLCLAASGGGHIRQLLDLQPLWQDADYFFVSEDTALGRSIAADHECEFVPHVALGQARLGKPVKMVIAGIRNCLRSFSIVRKSRPDVVITTGAGSMFFIVLWARLFGARIALIDSFARFKHPSAFAKLAGPFANICIAQSDESAKHWPGSTVFDPFRKIDDPVPEKESLLFATVGATLPFDRLVNLIEGAKASGLISESVIVQIGEGGREPAGMDVFETLSFDEVKAILRRASIVVCHGGTGSLITALREGCKVIAVPRRFDRGEHYDDHQSEITEVFKDRGLIQIADTPEEFEIALEQARASLPVRATTDPSALIDYLKQWIAQSQKIGELTL